MVDPQLSRSFHADPGELAEVRRFVRQSAEEARLPDETTADLVLSVYEAAANSILHSGSDRFHLRWRALEDRVEIEIQDEGVFRRRVRVPLLEGRGGLGIPLMMSFTDEFELHEGTPSRPGTRVRLVKFRAGGRTGPSQVSPPQLR
jgi:anti-sigma regulatory factor (Ser/Thr protein kinase)